MIERSTMLTQHAHEARSLQQLATTSVSRS
jgi:hypothetical protein